MCALLRHCFARLWLTPARLILIWIWTACAFGLAAWFQWSIIAIDKRLLDSKLFENGPPRVLRVSDQHARNVSLLAPYLDEFIVHSILRSQQSAILIWADKLEVIIHPEGVAQNIGLAVAANTAINRTSHGRRHFRCIDLGGGAAVTVGSARKIAEFGSGERCDLRSLPERWGVVHRNLEERILVVPLEFADEILGRMWRAKVTIAIVSDASTPYLGTLNMDPLDISLREDVEMEVLGGHGRESEKEVADLYTAMRWLCLIAFAAFIGCLLLLIEGQRPLIRKEVGLRLALGADHAATRTWLVRDAAAQAMIATGPFVTIALLDLTVFGFVLNAQNALFVLSAALLSCLASAGLMAVILQFSVLRMDPALLVKELR